MSWASDLVEQAQGEWFRRQHENEAALDAGLPLPHPDVPPRSRELRILCERAKLTFGETPR
jgi:hypothetical protein